MADHVEAISNKIYQQLLTLEASLTLVSKLVMPIFDCADFVWGDKNNLY